LAFALGDFEADGDELPRAPLFLLFNVAAMKAAKSGCALLGFD
jgi:hypothetical protein